MSARGLAFCVYGAFTVASSDFLYEETMTGMADAISEGLGRYLIGEKLRPRRLRKSMGLVELGRHTGLSATLLSKL